MNSFSSAVPAGMRQKMKNNRKRMKEVAARIGAMAVATLMFAVLTAAPAAFDAGNDAGVYAAVDYPWSPKAATGDYIADSYDGIEKGHVFESVTQERLLDILSSPGDYYIVFGGPNIPTSQKILREINAQAKADGIAKIYHFNPYIDGYQADISKSDTPYKTTQSIYQLWTRVTALLPVGVPIAGYDSSDTLLILYNRNESDPGTQGTIRSYYTYTAADLAALSSFDAAGERAEIAKVFRGAAIAPASLPQPDDAGGDVEVLAGALDARDGDWKVQDTQDGEVRVGTEFGAAKGEIFETETELPAGGFGQLEETNSAEAIENKVILLETVQAEEDSDSESAVGEALLETSAATDLTRSEDAEDPLEVLADPVIPASVRSDYQFFNRVFNAQASRIELNRGTANANRIGSSVDLFEGISESDFKLRQIGFAELQNLYNTPGEHLILFGASWCHNTAAVIGTIASEAAAEGKINTVYVYDTTLGNQGTYGTGANINTSTNGSSNFNSRNSATTDPAGNNNVSYIYGEAVLPLGRFITENESYKSNSIAYYPDGDLTQGELTTNPFSRGADNPEYDPALHKRNAIRLQLPFLIAFDKDAAKPVVRQWLHEQQLSENDGKYLEYMLELAWVRATDLAKADTSVYSNGARSDTEQTKVAIASEAAGSIKAFIADAADQRKDDENGGGDNDDGIDNNDGGNNGGNGDNSNSSNAGNNTNNSGSLSSNASIRNTANTFGRSTTVVSGSASSGDANTDDLGSELSESLAEPPVAEDIEGIDPLNSSLSDSVSDDEENGKSSGVLPWIPIAIAAAAGISVIAIIARAIAALKR
jgi:hypothetical protein